jgi:hypothetical protein
MTPAQKKDFDRAIKFCNNVRAIRIVMQALSDDKGVFVKADVYRKVEPYMSTRQWRGLLGSMRVQGLYTPINTTLGKVVTHGKD